jgi:hypothetical protein
MTVCIVLLLCAGSGVAVRGARTDSLEEKLGTVTEFVPKATAPVDQLVEVGQRFNIPMAIEWVESSRKLPPDRRLPSGKRSVRELLEEIASPEHRVIVDVGLVRIYSPTESLHPFNFLNIRLKSYSVTEADLFDAENQLRWAITFKLEPEKYRYGFNGGYGHGSNHVFEIPKFTLSESNVTIRDVLNRIALAQGNALWVARIKSEDLEGDEPCWRREGVNSVDDLPVTSAWHFLPLAEIAELATEQVAVDVIIPGVLDERMTTIPVILEHGLSGDSGGSIGGSSSEGNSFQYGCSIEKVGKDFVTLSVHLTVSRTGEPAFTFDQKFEIYKNRITEIQPEPRIRIRAYFENAAKR